MAAAALSPRTRAGRRPPPAGAGCERADARSAPPVYPALLDVESLLRGAHRARGSVMETFRVLAELESGSASGLELPGCAEGLQETLVTRRRAAHPGARAGDARCARWELIARALGMRQPAARPPHADGASTPPSPSPSAEICTRRHCAARR